MTRRRRFETGSQSGMAVVELLMIFPVMVLFLELIVLGGRVGVAGSDVATAAREAARQATLTNSRGAAVGVVAPVALRSLVDRGYACEAPTASLGAATRFEAGGVVEVVVRCRLNLSDLDLLSVAPGGIVVEQRVVEPIDRYRAVQ